MNTMQTRIKLKRDTTANWNAAIGFMPLKGEIIIYEDYQQITVKENGEDVIKNIPGIKIGTGNVYVQELPFIDKDLRDRLIEHIEDQEIHVTLGEKAFWNNKINIDDWSTSESEIVDDNLIFTRN